MAEYTTIAAVDLGSNSFHCQIARVDGEQTYPLDGLREAVRLGAGLDDEDERVLVTVGPDLDDFLHMPGRRALVPKLPARPAPVMRLPRRQRRGQRSAGARGARLAGVGEGADQRYSELPPTPMPPRLHEWPFDSQRKRMTTFHADDGGVVAYTKGAPEAVLRERIAARAASASRFVIASTMLWCSACTRCR